MKRIISALALLTVLAACSADETDFKETAEDLAVELAQESNPGFTAQAECQEPASTDVGTTFDCTVTFSDGDQLTVTAEITGEDQVRVGPGG